MVNREELIKGMKVEQEHKNTYLWFCQYFKKNKKCPDPNEFFMKIALDHLMGEDPKYYEKLDKAGL